MKHFTIAWVIPFMVGFTVSAQHQNVVIGEPQYYGLPAEPSVCINPANPDEILVAAMPDNYYISTDAGQNWLNGTLQSPWGVQADPCVLVDQAGRYYYIHLPNEIVRVVCHRMENISAPWTLETNVAFDGTHDVDKEWAAYDPVNDRIYLSWTYFDTWGSSNPNDSSCIFLSWTANGGESWADPVRVSDTKGNATGGNYSVHGSYLTTGPEGELYVAWWCPAGLMFDRSADGGITWLDQDINITQQHINWLYTIPGVAQGVSFPVIACDRSGGPYHGNLYICWADKRYGSTNTDVFLVKSSDGGLSWSDPIRVNDDLSITHQYFPFVTVDQITGKVWLVFYDRRNYTDTNTDVYMAVSTDGGNSFTNFRISETPFIPYSSAFYGHYIGVAAHNDHVFPVWTRMDEGEGTLMGALVNTGLVGQEELQLSPFATIENSPNPFIESSFISFRLRAPAIISLSLHDLAGRKVTTLINRKKYDTGKYVEKVRADELGLSPGTYLITLSSETEVFSRKIVLVN